MILRVLSPTHIGSGEVLTDIDYVYIHTNEKVRVIDYERAWREDSRIRERIERGVFNPREASNYYKYELKAFCKPRGKVLEHIKVLGKPYIPGSSLKGAIRTAILWKYLKDRSLKVKSIGELRKFEQELFTSNKRDLMSLLVVRDSKPVSLENLGVYETAVLSEASDGDRPILKEKKFRIYTESLIPKTKLEIDLVVKSKDLESWKDAIAEFTRHVISIERDFFERRDNGMLSEVLKFIDEIERRLDSGKIVFRLGFSTGWLWKTVGSLLSKKERVILARKLRLSRRLGLDFPKTRRVIVDAFGRYKWLPGWLEIED
ncbi:type III-A CRISPR-associated RAMP protein Csm5 [Archaeoglobus sp.]